MTRVDFYAGVADPARLAFALAQKASRNGQRVWVLTRDAAHSAELDRQLWQQPVEGFLPHCQTDHPLAAQTPVLIDHRADQPPHEDILLNLGDTVPSCFSRFRRVLELVGADPASIEAGRQRYRFYRDRGYPLSSHDMSGDEHAGRDRRQGDRSG